MKPAKPSIILAALAILLLAACKPLSPADQPAQATNTQEFVHAAATGAPSETPLPAGATEPREPAAPTSAPTEAVLPSATLPPKEVPTATTVSLDTPPGSLLSEGQYWRQDDVSLVLEGVDYYPDQSCAAFAFDLDNNSSQELIVTILASQFALSDNLGNVWSVRMLSHSSLCGTSQISADSQIAVSIEPGGSFWDGGYTTWLLSFDGPLTDPAVTELILTVNGLSHFTDARWVIPIAR